MLTLTKLITLKCIILLWQLWPLITPIFTQLKSKMKHHELFFSNACDCGWCYLKMPVVWKSTRNGEPSGHIISSIYYDLGWNNPNFTCYLAYYGMQPLMFPSMERLFVATLFFNYILKMHSVTSSTKSHQNDQALVKHPL